MYVLEASIHIDGLGQDCGGNSTTVVQLQLPYLRQTIDIRCLIDGKPKTCDKHIQLRFCYRL